MAARQSSSTSSPWFCGCTVDSVAVAVTAATGPSRPAPAPAADGVASAARQIRQEKDDLHLASHDSTSAQ
ncbi:hypothetical protein ACP4OV_016843 [Aristida adscensionis]